MKFIKISFLYNRHLTTDQFTCHVIYNRSGRVESGLEGGLDGPGTRGVMRPICRAGSILELGSPAGPAGSTINPNFLAPWFIRRFPGLQS